MLENFISGSGPAAYDSCLCGVLFAFGFGFVFGFVIRFHSCFGSVLTKDET
jgi:hypothetical protein